MAIYPHTVKTTTIPWTENVNIHTDTNKHTLVRTRIVPSADDVYTTNPLLTKDFNGGTIFIAAVPDDANTLVGLEVDGGVAKMEDIDVMADE